MPTNTIYSLQADAPAEQSRVRLTAPAKPAATGAARPSGLVQAGDSRSGNLAQKLPQLRDGHASRSPHLHEMQSRRDPDGQIAGHARRRFNLPPSRDEVISNYIGKYTRRGVYPRNRWSRDLHGMGRVAHVVPSRPARSDEYPTRAASPFIHTASAIIAKRHR